MRYNAERFFINADKIGILGFSAGGHLAATASTHHDAGDKTSDDPIEKLSCRPDFSILCYAVISFKYFPHVGSYVNLLGENPDESLLEDLSNDMAVKADTPPSFLWHTADDEAVPVENSLNYAKALSKYDIPFELHVFPSGRHGLGLAEDFPTVAKWTKLCAAWLENI